MDSLWSQLGEDSPAAAQAKNHQLRAQEGGAGDGSSSRAEGGRDCKEEGADASCPESRELLLDLQSQLQEQGELLSRLCARLGPAAGAAEE